MRDMMPVSTVYNDARAEFAETRLSDGTVRCSFASACSTLPLVISPRMPALAEDRAAAFAWFAQRAKLIDTLLHEYGGVLLRGFAVPDTASFRRLTELYPPHAFGYIAGAAPRKSIDGGVYESTRMPAPFKIGLHQEKAYMPDYPRLLAFYCNRPPEAGGETPLADMRAVTRRLAAGQALERFREKGVMYRRNFAGPGNAPQAPASAPFAEYHRRWSDAFMTDDRERVEALCRETRLACEWLADGSVTVSHVGRATVVHPVTGEEVWFNQASAQHVNPRSMGELSFRYLQLAYKSRAALPYEIRYGDGTPMQAADLDPVYDAMDAEETAFAWRRGDVLLIDNILVAHGRNPFEGARDIQVALLD
ncbi:TauD/TfdA family dioxygenase [Trinickia symbiotica]|nr:TauD/TfdA family dioxygenase [Trinickia symbiotica]